MQLAQGTTQITHQLIKGRRKSLMTCHKYIIMPRASTLGHDMADSLTQATANAVAHHRIADLLRDGEPDTNLTGITTVAPLHQAASHACSPRLGGGEKISAFTEAIQGRRTSG